jgi:hypothetical protein
MLVLAEIADKSPLPLNPFLGALLLALIALVACAVLVEFGPWYSIRLLCWVVLLHAPVVLLMAKWPRRWSKPWQDGTACRECGYDLRGLPNTTCPECGSESGSSRPV